MPVHKNAYTPIYSREFRSSLENMASAIKEALTVLTDHGWIAPDAQFELRLCLEEALVNAIHHGNRGDEGLLVRLEIHEGDCECLIRVHDKGGGFRPCEVPEPGADTTPGGRGLCLIKHFMDDVRYCPDEQCFEMTFSRKDGCKGERTNE